MKNTIKLINSFYGGIVRDDKSTVQGAASNMEELDIFSNKDYIQAEQILTADTMPASTEIYAYAAGDDDTVYGYGRETGAGKVTLVSVASGGATDPGSFGALFTSSDATNLATTISDFKFFRTTEASNPTSLYYIKGASATWYISRYNIGATAEQRWTGSAWSASGSWDSNSQLTGLSGSFDRPTMKVIYGELFICHGQYIAKIDDDGVFTEKAFTLPSEWQAVDIIPVSDIAIILCRNKNKNINKSIGLWWDLTSASQFNDSFNIPVGGPQWIFNHKETIKFLCATNGRARLFQLSGAFPGAVPIELPGILIDNVATETTTQPISSPKMVAEKDKILYFGLWKTDKSGVYAIGQLDADKPNALILSKRFHTTDYSAHKPTSLLIQGQNYYVSFVDNTTASHARCEGGNSPTRSSNATYESIWIDGGDPTKDKDLNNIILLYKKLTTGTAFAVYVASDYDNTYYASYQADGTSPSTLNSLLARTKANLLSPGNKAYKVKIVFTSNTSTSPKLQAIGLDMNIHETISAK